MPVQLDIAGNLAKGAALREGIQLAGEARQARQLANIGRREALKLEMGGVLPDSISQLYDPYEFKMGEMFKGLFDGERRRERMNRRALASQGIPSARGAIAADVDRMQDFGGQPTYALPVQPELTTIKKYVDGGEVEPDSYLSVLGERALDTVRPRNVIPNYLRESARTDERVFGAVSGFGDASARERGRMIRNAAIEGGVGAYRQIGGFLQDVAAPAMPLVEGVMGALGFTGEYQGDGADSSPEKASPDDAAQAISVAEQEGPPEPDRAAAQGPPEPASSAAGRRAQQSPFVGQPAADQAAARLGNIDIMPDDMPTMGTRDWVEYRAKLVPALMMQGATAQEAHEQVSTMQHQGFMRYAQQANAMLQANNLKGAARALKAAYQYFPNGSDVRFGFQNGNLVALGISEETGEPVGKPQVVSPEYLSAMIGNFQDPAKYLTWTKDWRDELFRDRTYTEVTRPQAQSEMDFRAGSLDVAHENAISNRMEAAAQQQLARARALGQGPSEADYDRAGTVFKEAILARGVSDQIEADRLASVMTQIRTQNQWRDVTNEQIIQRVMKAYEDGTLDVALQRLGIM